MEASNRAHWLGSVIARKISDALRRQMRRPRSYRLIFRFDQSGITLHSRTPRLQPAPPSDALDGVPRDDTIVAELRSAADVVLYRQRLRNPIPQDVEIFDNGVPRRVNALRLRGTFSIIVPNLQGESPDVVIDAGPAVSLAQQPFAALEKGATRRRLIQLSLTGGNDERQ